MKKEERVLNKQTKSSDIPSTSERVLTFCQIFFHVLLLLIMMPISLSPNVLIPFVKDNFPYMILTMLIFGDLFTSFYNKITSLEGKQEPPSNPDELSSISFSYFMNVLSLFVAVIAWVILYIGFH